MATLASVIQYLDALLTPQRYSDEALNGVQVQSCRSEVRSVAFAVDAGRSVVDQAIAAGADLLVVHHGIFWGKQEALVGPFGRKVEALLAAKCSLYASHLPLDGHPEVGNAYELGRFLGVENLAGFCEYHGGFIGAKGIFRRPKTLEALLEGTPQLQGGRAPLVLPFGPKEIKTVAVVTGSGAFALELCSKEGIDLLVSGEPKQSAYHLAKELGVNAIFYGHYATETFGVAALKARVARDFDVTTIFIHEETGI